MFWNVFGVRNATEVGQLVRRRMCHKNDKECQKEKCELDKNLTIDEIQEMYYKANYYHDDKLIGSK